MPIRVGKIRKALTGWAMWRETAGWEEMGNAGASSQESVAALTQPGGLQGRAGHAQTCALAGACGGLVATPDNCLKSVDLLQLIRLHNAQLGAPLPDFYI